MDDSENTISILVATDNHLGYMERDAIRQDDSLLAFEEILKLAKVNEVDMVLLGGDLFHENKPSRKTLYATMKLIRQYCMGDKPCEINFLSDESIHFSDEFSQVNYLDPNYNIAIPIFSIHGNHDDPNGDGNLCALNLLSVAGLVNYFGRVREIDDVVISPMLLQKGTTRLALYGLGNIRDERLHRTFLEKKVKMMRPTEYQDKWFNLMVLHQNRIMHSKTNYIPENFLADFLHLIIWGHEHECLIEPEFNMEQEFYVTQPGSSVATSLCEGEAVQKHVALLKIKGDKFDLQKIRLRSVRPFVMDNIFLSQVDGLEPTDDKALNEFLTEKVEDMIQKAVEDWMQLHSDDMIVKNDVPKPLIRLKVEYTGGFNIFNPQRFGQQFVDRVANSKDIISFYRKRVTTTSEERKSKLAIDPVDLETVIPERLDQFRVDDLVQEFLGAQKLEILPENELGDAVRMFVEKDDKDAIKEFVTESLDRTIKILKQQKVNDDDEILQLVTKEKRNRSEAYAKENANNDKILNSKRKVIESDDVEEKEMEDEEMEDSDQLESASNLKSKRKTPIKSTRGSNRDTGSSSGRVRSTRAVVMSSRGKKKDDKNDTNNDSDKAEEDYFSENWGENLTPTTSPVKRKLPTSATVPATKRQATNRAKSNSGRQAKLDFSSTINASQQYIILDDDDDDDNDGNDNDDRISNFSSNTPRTNLRGSKFKR